MSATADFLLELLSEEIPARMQARARNDLVKMLAEALDAAGVAHAGIETFSTPRRLALIARSLPLETAAVSEEVKGPRSSAPPQALEGFLRKTGLKQDQLEDRDGIWFAKIEQPGRATGEILKQRIPSVILQFPWPKSMRWGHESLSSGSLRWVRPLHNVLAFLGREHLELDLSSWSDVYVGADSKIAAIRQEFSGVTSNPHTLGHRFHHPGPITIGGAHDYVAKLRACHVLVDQAERETIIRDGARELADTAGYALVEDEGLVVENAGLTEWPVPLLGSFDPDFLDVPEEVIQLTARINQKYFVARDPTTGRLAPHFVCTANIDANDGGTAIIAGNERVLAARLSDARFFWQQDVKVSLAAQAAKLGQIVFHEKIGTVADKVERVARLAQWLIEEGIVTKSPLRLAGGVGGGLVSGPSDMPSPSPSREREGNLADDVERAARLAKADLVSGMVGEFPELQGVIGGHLARAQGENDAVADAVRDHYRPVGQSDEVPTAPVTVAVSLADKLDSLATFFVMDMVPTGSKDPFALRRAALGVLALLQRNNLRLPLVPALAKPMATALGQSMGVADRQAIEHALSAIDDAGIAVDPLAELELKAAARERMLVDGTAEIAARVDPAMTQLMAFFADRLKVQQREAGVRHDLIDAVFALGGEDDLVRLLARVTALQAFVETGEGANLLAGYKRAANILKQAGNFEIGSGREALLPIETELLKAIDYAAASAESDIASENFEGAMRALASLRQPIDAFFDGVMINDPDPAKRAFRLNLLARFRDAVNSVADFSRIEG